MKPPPPATPPPRGRRGDSKGARSPRMPQDGPTGTGTSPLPSPAADAPAVTVGDSGRGGMFVVCFHVPGRPVPWSVPTVFRNGGSKKNARLIAWQQTVGMFARLAMHGRELHAGPVEIAVVATIAAPRDRRYRDPDCTNIVKAIEDALQGIVIVNDRQVCRQYVERVRGDDERAVIRVKGV